MLKVALAGLFGRKLRTVLTAIAIVLGVAMVTGTYILTDSIKGAFDGIFTEIYRDRSLRLAPVDLPTAHAMVAEVKAFATLRGFRGKRAGDIEALAKAIVALSRLALQNDPAIAEAEVNPLIVRTDGVVAVDALVKEM